MLPKRYFCHRVSQAPKLTGWIDDSIWSLAPWTDDFVDIEGDRKLLPPLRTRSKMMWDEEFLYIAAEMEEPHLWATYTDHDSVIFHENDFEVFIDPDGDCASYFEFEINALGTYWDLHLEKAYRDGGSADNSWEIPGLIAAVGLDGTLNDPTDRDNGWTVELAFPWTAFAEKGGMRCPPRLGDVWRVNFSRVEWDLEVVEGRYRKIAGQPEHNWVWSPQGVIDMHQPEMWGFVEFGG